MGPLPDTAVPGRAAAPARRAPAPCGDGVRYGTRRRAEEPTPAAHDRATASGATLDNLLADAKNYTSTRTPLGPRPDTGGGPIR